MARLKVVGFDPSLRNWGVAVGWYDTVTRRIQIDQLDVIQPVLPTGKQVRQNSLDLESAFQLCAGALAYARQAQAVFVEVPVGSQSARAMASYGICVGVLGGIRAHGIPFIEVSPTEVKLAACRSKTATKEQMIEWASANHPEAPWPLYKSGGEVKVSAAKAEHMADAVAAIHAGLASTPFQQVLPLLQAVHSNEEHPHADQTASI